MRLPPRCSAAGPPTISLPGQRPKRTLASRPSTPRTRPCVGWSATCTTGPSNASSGSRWIWLRPSGRRPPATPNRRSRTPGRPSCRPRLRWTSCAPSRAGSLPPLLADRGLVAAISALAEESPLHVGTDLDPALDAAVPPEVARATYFVVAELLTNTAKHSRATDVHIVARIHWDEPARLRVERHRRRARRRHLHRGPWPGRVAGTAARAAWNASRWRALPVARPGSTWSCRSPRRLARDRPRPYPERVDSDQPRTARRGRQLPDSHPAR